MLTEQKFPKFDAKLYTQIALNDLVVYTVYFLSQSEREITTEDIVAACFLMFPERFSMRSYPQWPDFSVVERRWLDCRNKAFIAGSTAKGFSITPNGLEIAEKIEKILTGKRSLIKRTSGTKIRTETRTRAGRFVRAIEESDAFRLYKEQSDNAQISEFDFRSMLLCTMESSAQTLRNNLEQFKQYAGLYERADLAAFLDFCQKKFGRLLADGNGRSGEYQGGMVRRRIK